ncbi:hypothetical protein D3C81_109680 [compost metagenome]|uniref:hypothetical protein n=1 Tax=Paenibacillus stellifer TaxID=169760 RepID=UPI000AF65354|nr:hypothetical protein [Paenibacillus stellifer]
MYSLTSELAGSIRGLAPAFRTAGEIKAEAGDEEDKQYSPDHVRIHGRLQVLRLLRETQASRMNQERERGGRSNA